MEDMQAVYDEEVGGRSGGLMSLLRAPLDIALDPSIMDNLPDILSALEKSSALEKAIRRGGTDQEMLEMKIESIDAQDPDESSLSVQLSNAPGILSLLDEAGYGTAATMLGMTGAGGKGKSFKELIDEIQRLAGKMASDKDMDATRYANEADLPDFLKSFSQKQKERRGEEGFQDMLQEYRDEYMDSPEALEKAMRVQRDILRKARRDGDMFAEGGRPGLYANIAAKRRRIAAGSGEKMRKPGSKGAPTKENFRQAETTAKKANGGGLSYAKGYYGKSYK